MKKQVGFDVISENIGQGGVPKNVLLERVQQYLDAGWEVLSTHVPQTSGGAITITVTLVKYEDEALPSESESVGVSVKRGRGRPKIVEEVVPT